LYSFNKWHIFFAGGWKLSVVLRNILVAYGYSVGRKVCWITARFIILHTYTHTHTHTIARPSYRKLKYVAMKFDILLEENTDDKL